MQPIHVHINARYLQGSCELKFGQYHDGSLAIYLLQGDGPPDTIKVSVCPSETDRADANMIPSEIAVKGWSENAGIPESLIQLGLLIDTGRRVDCGHTSAKIVNLSDQLADRLVALYDEALSA